MRLLVVLASTATVLTFLFKWRYRLVNTLLAITVLRKLAVILSMNMPAIRAKVLPGIFKTEA
jgi:hypothetical protein